MTPATRRPDGPDPIASIPAPPAPANTPLRFGYGTNGLADLRLDDALTLLADLGYDGVGLTLDHMHLDPLAPDLTARTQRLAGRLDALDLDVTVETGARYVLDPRRKHGPSLLDPDPDDRARRVGLLIRAVQVAADLGAHAVHCFSGVTPAGTDPDTAWKRLAEALTPVLEVAADAGVPLAVEPEPGHLLGTLADFHRLRHILGDPENLGLTLDIGHCQCLEPLSPADCVRAAAPWLRHVQIEDMRRGVHEHLPFGDGDIDFPPVLAALAATGYQGLTVVELPRHSHAGPHFAEHSLPFLHHAASQAAALPMAQPDPALAPNPGPDPARSLASGLGTGRGSGSGFVVDRGPGRDPGRDPDRDLAPGLDPGRGPDQVPGHGAATGLDPGLGLAPGRAPGAGRTPDLDPGHGPGLAPNPAPPPGDPSATPEGSSTS